MEMIVALIMVPCVAALLMLAVRNDKARDAIAIGFAALIGLLSIVFAGMYLGASPVYFELPHEWSGFRQRRQCGRCDLTWWAVFVRVLCGALSPSVAAGFGAHPNRRVPVVRAHRAAWRAL